MSDGARPLWVSWIAKGLVIAILLWLYFQLRRLQGKAREKGSDPASAPARDGSAPGPREAGGPARRAETSLVTPPGSSAAAFYLSLLCKSLDERYGQAEWVAHGGAGVIFRARDFKEGRVVGIKMLSPLLADDERAHVRFKREAAILARLQHPGVVKVFDVSGADPPYFVMEWVEGESLAVKIEREGAMAWKAAVPMIRSAARALGAAHAIGLLHRDVKPDNLLMTAGGAVKWIDFGLAHAETLTKLTRTGEVMGTPMAMAPEQIRGERALPATDVYGLGVTAFYALTGAYPFTGNPVYQHLNVPAPDVGAEVPGLPRDIADVLNRCLAKRPEERYADGEALAQALETARGSETIVGRSAR